MGQPSIYHATVALSFQIEICNLDRTKSSFLATSLYKKVIITKNWVTRSCRPSDVILITMIIAWTNGSLLRFVIVPYWWNLLEANACKQELLHINAYTVRPRLSGHIGTSTYPDKWFGRIWEICLNTASSVGLNTSYNLFTHCYSICNKLSLMFNGLDNKIKQIQYLTTLFLSWARL